MSDLEPITRAENFWVNEGDLEPITRKEQYIKHLYDETQVVPEYPKTREEYFINKAGEGLHDVTIEQLTATENGTYSEEGVAYSPVIVNVPAPVLDELTVTENGTYTPGSGTDGYNEVNVNVQPTLAMKSITANGTYNASDDNADGYSSVSVNVPLPSNAYLLQTIEHESIATFTDGTDNFLKSLEVAVEPQQDLHGYDHPWVGGAGKNQLEPKGYDGLNYNTSVGTTVTLTETTSTITVNRNVITYSVSAWSGIGFVSKPLSAGDYYVHLDISGNNRMSLYRINENNKITFTEYFNTVGQSIANSYSVQDNERIAIWIGNNNASNITITNPQIESGGSYTSWEPYSNICPISGWDECKVTVADDLENPTVSNVYTIDLDGTRYGGKLDVVSGVLTVDWVLKTLVGTETWFYSSTYNRVYTYISDAKKPSGATIYSILSDKLHFSSGVNEDYGAHINNAGNLIVFAPSSITSDDQWKTWLASNNVQVVYELATPLTIQLTPTIIKSLQGENNFFASTGEIELLQYWGEVS